MENETKLRLAVAGIQGKMGMDIAKLASKAKELTLTVATISPNKSADLSVSEMIGVPGFDFFPTNDLEKEIEKFDVLIDFSSVTASLQNLKLCLAHKKAIVIGTTGFSEDQLNQIKQAAQTIPVVFASNMSRGINLILNLLKQLTALIGQEADIEIIEAHHRHKKDAPSGTALTMGETIADTLGEPLDNIASYERKGYCDLGRDEKIGFSVVRAGDIVGEHTAIFALPDERIEIKHIASSRSTFSQGALVAARWIHDKAPGLYSMQDVLGIH